MISGEGVERSMVSCVFVDSQYSERLLQSYSGWVCIIATVAKQREPSVRLGCGSVRCKLLTFCYTALCWKYPQIDTYIARWTLSQVDTKNKSNDLYIETAQRKIKYVSETQISAAHQYSKHIFYEFSSYCCRSKYKQYWLKFCKLANNTRTIKLNSNSHQTYSSMRNIH